MNINEDVIKGVQMMFNNLVIKTGDNIHHIGRGLGQGWGVSCMLFNIFTNDLTTNILEINMFPKIYADDTNIIGEDKKGDTKNL